jgi:hypothetical protein
LPPQPPTAPQEWRENRKLSLAVRDLVETGHLDEARAMCDEQVAAFMGRLLSDAAYRAEYTAGWAEQRKYVVSDLLPGSGVAAAPDARDTRGRAGKSAAEAPRGEPKVQGAVKAAALIEQLMAQAQATVAAQRGSQPAAPVETEESAESGDGEAPEANGSASAAADANGGAYRPPAAARAVPGATEELLAAPKRSGKPKGASASVAKAMAEVPVLPDIEFEVPAVVTGREEQSAGLTPEEVKVGLGSGLHVGGLPALALPFSHAPPSLLTHHTPKRSLRRKSAKRTAARPPRQRRARSAARRRLPASGSLRRLLRCARRRSWLCQPRPSRLRLRPRRLPSPLPAVTTRPPPRRRRPRPPSPRSPFSASPRTLPS